MCNRFFTDLESVPVIIIGDFNVPMNKPNEANTLKFNNLMNDFALENKIEVPTFRRSQNTLDLLIDSYVDPWATDITVRDSISFSDHALIEFTLKDLTTLSRKSLNNINYRLINEETMKVFSDTFRESHTCSPQVSFLELAQGFRVNTSQAFENSFTEIERVISTIPRNDWYTSECKNAKILSRKAEITFLNHPTQENEIQMKKLWNLSVRTIGNAQENY